MPTWPGRRLWGGRRRQHPFGGALGTLFQLRGAFPSQPVEPPLGQRGHCPPSGSHLGPAIRPPSLPAPLPCLGAPGGLVLVGLQLLRQGLPKALFFDALQQRGGQERLQAPFFPSRRERGLVRQARRASRLFPLPSRHPWANRGSPGPSGSLGACGVYHQGGRKGKWSGPGARGGSKPC